MGQVITTEATVSTSDRNPDENPRQKDVSPGQESLFVGIDEDSTEEPTGLTKAFIAHLASSLTSPPRPEEPSLQSTERALADPAMSDLPTATTAKFMQALEGRNLELGRLGPTMPSAPWLVLDLPDARELELSTGSLSAEEKHYQRLDLLSYCAGALTLIFVISLGVFAGPGSMMLTAVAIVLAHSFAWVNRRIVQGRWRVQKGEETRHFLDMLTDFFKTIVSSSK